VARVGGSFRPGQIGTYQYVVSHVNRSLSSHEKAVEQVVGQAWKMTGDSIRSAMRAVDSVIDQGDHG
jgi:predicted fused transcriptional regulator/phosphomethylpyrimidine kinase